jgi:hypothetical protein
MRPEASDRVRVLTQIFAAFGQIVMTSLAFEVQQIGRQTHRPHGGELSGGLWRSAVRL